MGERPLVILLVTLHGKELRITIDERCLAEGADKYIQHSPSVRSSPVLNRNAWNYELSTVELRLVKLRSWPEGHRNRWTFDMKVPYLSEEPVVRQRWARRASALSSPTSGRISRMAFLEQRLQYPRRRRLTVASLQEGGV
ncbi:hypothetical protein J6590_082159 [Homalodisca vitripennis]|nr:hypothetical protein J6590_082159 [Homalodisca vitripennis]